MDDESGDDDRDELASKCVSRDTTAWRNWRNESGSNSRHGVHAYLNERSVIFNEEMVGGREMVT